LAVKIRLRRMGTRGKPFYRMVVADGRSARNGRFIEVLGYYNPCVEPPIIKLEEEKVLLWLNRGAQPSDTVQALLKKENIYGKFLAGKEKKVAEAVPTPVAEEPEVAEAKPARKRRTKAAAETTEAPAKAEVAEEVKPTEETEPAAEAEAVEEVQPTEEQA